MGKLASRIVEVREARGLERKEAALGLELPYSTYAKYENGEREPDVATLRKIADYLNVSLDYLYGRPDSPEWIDRFPPGLRDWLLNIAPREFLMAVKAAWDDGATAEEIIIYAGLLRQVKQPKKDS